MRGEAVRARGVDVRRLAVQVRARQRVLVGGADAVPGRRRGGRARHPVPAEEAGRPVHGPRLPPRGVRGPEARALRRASAQGDRAGVRRGHARAVRRRRARRRARAGVPQT